MRFLRAAALLAQVVGAVGSLAVMFYIGRRQQSLALIALFTGWVVSPFAALLWAERASKDERAVDRAVHYVVMLVVSLISLGLYGSVLVTQPAKPAAMFLLVPLGSWLLIAAHTFVSGRLPGRPRY